MKKLKIYLDTCVIGNLDEQGDPKVMAEAHTLWEMIKAGEFDVVVSSVTLDEINDIKNLDKIKILYDYLSEITFEKIMFNDEIEHIADIVKNSGLISSEKKLNDRRHIGGTLVSRADILVSTNYKDLVNATTALGVKKIALVEGYGFVEIYPPSMLINNGGKS